MAIVKKIKEALTRMRADTGMGREFKDVFELSGVPSFNQFYEYGIFVWKWLYKGFYNAWHIVPLNSIALPTDRNGKPIRTRELFRLGIPKAVCAELSGLIWSEQCQVNVNLNGFEPTEDEPEDKLQRFIDSVLHRNNFHVKMQECIEQMLALGGEALKVWYEEKRDDDGNVVPGTGGIRIGYCMADQFIPLAWDNASVTEGVFISRQAKDGYYFTRLEWHKWNGLTYVISNELYRSEIRKNSSQESQDILGFRYPLAALYPYLNEEAAITGLEASLFSYMRTPIANNVDDNSPLGVSIYANALSTLRALDICFDSFVREFQLGKKRIIVPASAVRAVADADGNPVRYFDATDEVYQALQTDDTDNLKIVDNSVEIRVEEHVKAINALLSILCLQLGFSASTFSFDQHTGLKTATEVVSENSKTYKTVKNCQNAIAPAIEKLVHNIITVAILYDVEFEGEKVSSWFAGGDLRNGYQCRISWDDSIIQDRQTNISEGILLIGNGLMSKTRFLTDTLGMTNEQAAAELARIANERKQGVEAVDLLNVFGNG